MRLSNWKRALLLAAVFVQAYWLSAQDVSLDELLEMDLEKLVELQSSGRGDVGAFGYRLGTNESSVQIHGYVTNEFIDQQESTSTFDNHYYNLFVGTSLGEQIFAEIQLEYEHGGDDIAVRYAQVDYKISDALIFRTGKFLVPINTFNEYLYPEYIYQSISRPFINRNIAPTAWAEVGAQLRGTFELSNNLNGYYSAYIVNGLEGDEGGDIRAMRNNNRDRNNDNKAIGGRLGVRSSELEVGAGIYNGAYTEDGEHNLTIVSFDAGYTLEDLTLRAEYGIGRLETSTGNIVRTGMAVSAAYLIAKKFQPVGRFDFMNWDDPTNPTLDRNRIYLGFNYLLSNTMNAKIGYEIIGNDGEDVKDNVLALQVALGF